MTAIELLKHEHKIVLMVLDGAVKEADSIRMTGKVDFEKISSIVDFIRNFADKCHHTKEENQLFKKMVERGMTGKNDPIDVMIREHMEGRRLVKSIADALPAAEKGDPTAVESVMNGLSSYSNLLRAHISKEDNVLYPLAERILLEGDMKQLETAFDRIEAEEMGEGTHEKYHQLAHNLSGIL